MPVIRLVAVDIDGTLLNEEGNMSGGTLAAIQAVCKKGVNITLATGRMFEPARHVALELGLSMPLITNQGALVKHSGTGEVLYKGFIPPELAGKVITKLKAFGCIFNIYLEDFLVSEKDAPVLRDFTQENKIPLKVVPDVTACLGEWKPLKILVMEEPVRLDKLQYDCMMEFAGRVDIIRTGPYMLWFVKPGINKARGLRIVANYFGVAGENIMAIGDGYNDMDMFQFAGLSVAMGNAPGEVRAAADYITGTNNEDGVAAALQRFIL